MIDRLVRRLQKPTLSKLVANGKVTLEYSDEIEEYQEKMRRRRPKSSKEQSKAIERVQRPTTASKRHVAINEAVADKRLDDEVVKTQYSYYKGEERVLTKDEEKKIVSRVMVKTNAFCGSLPHCPKIHNEEESLTLNQRKQYGLPLVSGLSRSQNVGEITTRLYVTSTDCRRPRRSASALTHRSSKGRGQTPVATTISVY